MLRCRQRRRRSFAVPPCDGKFDSVRNAARLSACAFFSPRIDFCAYPVERPLSLFAFNGALPDDNQIPAGVAPCLFVAMVAFDVFRPLLHPESDIRLRHGRILATMPVPEASAHVDYRLRLWNHNVRFATESLVAHPVPPTAGEKPLPDEDFRQSVFAVYLRHQPAALFWSDRIHLKVGKSLGVEPDAPIPRHERNQRLPVVGRVKYDFVFLFCHQSLLVKPSRCTRH